MPDLLLSTKTSALSGKEITKSSVDSASSTGLKLIILPSDWAPCPKVLSTTVSTDFEI
ncbi:MAG: hypothetical protein M1450_02940 [Patescibacteria group bacterium]|nr:hypothetical protein [Patescibacteria group bacterium]